MFKMLYKSTVDSIIKCDVSIWEEYF